MARPAKPKSSTVEHPSAPELSANRTVNGLYAAACEAGKHVHAHEAQHVEKHTGIVLKALQCVMELVELGKEQPAELQSLLDYHKTRKDLDTIGRIVKLVFPNETAQLRNCYAQALRHAERHGQTADQTPSFLREKGIKKAARDEAARTGKASGADRPSIIIDGVEGWLTVGTLLVGADGNPNVHGKFEIVGDGLRRGIKLIPSPPFDMEKVEVRNEKAEAWWLSLEREAAASAPAK